MTYRDSLRAEAEALHDDALKAAVDEAGERYRSASSRARSLTNRNERLDAEAEARAEWAHLGILKAVKEDRRKDYVKRYRSRAGAIAAGMVEPLAVLDVVADLGPTTRARVRDAFARMVEEHLKAAPEPYDSFGLGYTMGEIEDAIDRRVTKAIATCLAEGDLLRVKGGDMLKSLGVRLGRVNANEWLLYTERQVEEAKVEAAAKVEVERQRQATWDALADHLPPEATREGGMVTLPLNALAHLVNTYARGG